jgi:hypothetical protein
VSKNLLKQIGVAPNKDEKAALRFDAISILHVSDVTLCVILNLSILTIIIDVLGLKTE